jgi:hypothetical protein
MTNDQVNIKIVDDIPATGETGVPKKGSELLVDSTTATALVFSGTAIQLPT